MKSLAFLFACLLMFLGSCQPRGTNSEVVIGSAISLTGQEGAGVYGENIRNSMELAISEINSKGGINGKLIRVIYEDTQLQPQVAVSAVNKLISVDKVKVIVGAVSSGETLAVAPICERNKVVLISPASTSHEISNSGDYIFRTIAPDTLEGNAMAKFALQSGYKTAAAVFVDNAGTKGPAEVFKQAFEAAGGKMVAMEVGPQGATDFRTQLAKVKAASPDAVYLLGYALELGNMLKQAKELGIQKPLLSFQVMEEPKVVEIAGNAANSVIFTSPTIRASEAQGRTKQFIDAYRQRYKKDPGIFSYNAYDAVYVVAKAIERYGEDGESIKKGLYEIQNYDGASGQISFDRNGDTAQPPKLLTYQNGQIVVYQPQFAQR